MFAVCGCFRVGWLLLLISLFCLLVGRLLLRGLVVWLLFSLEFVAYFACVEVVGFICGFTCLMVWVVSLVDLLFCCLVCVFDYEPRCLVLRYCCEFVACLLLWRFDGCCLAVVFVVWVVSLRFVFFSCLCLFRCLVFVLLLLLLVGSVWFVIWLIVLIVCIFFDLI